MGLRAKFRSRKSCRLEVSGGCNSQLLYKFKNSLENLRKEQ